MTNKLKGLLIGFGILFIIAFMNSSSRPHFSELNMTEKLTFPFFIGLIGAVIGFLVGSGIKEKS
jgi:hypothetical protein